MIKLLVFAILLAVTPAFSLIENLFQAENNCYSGCNSNYGASSSHLDACRKGCNYKLYNEDCADRCKSHATDEQIQASCLVGCSMYHSEVPTESIEVERPRSIILIRLRQRPMLQIPSFNNDPIQMFNDMIRQLKENTNDIEQSNDLSRTIVHLTKNIPLIKFSNEDDTNKVEHLIIHRQEKIQSLNNRLQQLVNDVRTEWKDLIRKQPQIPIWILLAMFLSSSIILWYMIVSLCRHTPTHRDLSIRAQELDFNDVYEKEKIQHYESLPSKVKLSNI